MIEYDFHNICQYIYERINSSITKDLDTKYCNNIDNPLSSQSKNLIPLDTLF